MVLAINRSFNQPNVGTIFGKKDGQIQSHDHNNMRNNVNNKTLKYFFATKPWNTIHRDDLRVPLTCHVEWAQCSIQIQCRHARPTSLKKQIGWYFDIAVGKWSEPYVFQGIIPGIPTVLHPKVPTSQEHLQSNGLWWWGHCCLERCAHPGPGLSGAAGFDFPTRV